jgi:hypothetical protein
MVSSLYNIIGSLALLNAASAVISPYIRPNILADDPGLIGNTTLSFKMPRNISLPKPTFELLEQGQYNQDTDLQSTSGGNLAQMTVGIDVEHFLQAVAEKTTYQRTYVKFHLFNEMYVNVDTSASAKVGLGFLARANFYMSAVAQSATEVDLEGEYESSTKVVYQNKNQIWRKVTTYMSIDGESLNQEIYEYVGVTEGTSVDLTKMSKEYLNTYLVPNNAETSTPYIDDVKHSEHFDVEMKMEQIDSNGICLHVTTGTGGSCESSDPVQAQIRLEKSEYLYDFKMTGLTSRGSTRIFCSDANKFVPSLQISDVKIHHWHDKYDDWCCAAGGFKVAINGKWTTWYLEDESYDHRTHFWTSGDSINGDLQPIGKDACIANLWCTLKSPDQ